MEFPCRASEHRERTLALRSQICKSFPGPTIAEALWEETDSTDQAAAAPAWSDACKAHRFPGLPENWKAKASSKKKRAAKALIPELTAHRTVTSDIRHFKAYGSPAVRFMGATAQKD